MIRCIKNAQYSIKIQRLNGIAMNNNNGFIKPFLAFMLALGMLFLAGCDSGSSSSGGVAGPDAPTDGSDVDAPPAAAAAAFYINTVDGVTNNNVTRGVLGQNLDASTDGLLFSFNGDFKNQATVVSNISVVAVDGSGNPLSVDASESLVTLDNQVKVVLTNKPADGSNIDVIFCNLASTQDERLTDGFSVGASTDTVKFDSQSAPNCVTVQLRAANAEGTTGTPAAAFYIDAVDGVTNNNVTRAVLGQNVNASVEGLFFSFTNNFKAQGSIVSRISVAATDGLGNPLTVDNTRSLATLDNQVKVVLSAKPADGSNIDVTFCNLESVQDVALSDGTDEGASKDPVKFDRQSSGNCVTVQLQAAEAEGSTSTSSAFYISAVDGVSNNSVTRGLLSSVTEASVGGLLVSFKGNFKSQATVVSNISVAATDGLGNPLTVDSAKSLVTLDNQVKVVLSGKPADGSNVDIIFCNLESVQDVALSDGTDEGASKDVVKFDTLAGGCVTLKLQAAEAEGSTSTGTAFYISEVDGVSNNNVTRGLLSQTTDASVGGLLISFTGNFKTQSTVISNISVVATDGLGNPISIDGGNSLVTSDNQVKIVLSAKPADGSNVDIEFCGLESVQDVALTDGSAEGASKDVVKFDAFAAGCVTLQLQAAEAEGSTGTSSSFYISAVEGVSNNSVTRGVLSSNIDASVGGILVTFKGNFKTQSTVVGNIFVTATDAQGAAISVDASRSLVTLDNQVRVVLSAKPADGSYVDIEFCNLESVQNVVLTNGSEEGASKDAVKFDIESSPTCVTVQLQTAAGSGSANAGAFYISTVSGVVNNSVSRGVLNENVDATLGFEIKFSNAVDTADFSAKRADIIIYSNTGAAAANYTHADIYLKSDDKTLVIPLNNNLADNESIDICVPLLEDQNGAELTDGHLEVGDTVKFDKEVGDVCGDNTDASKAFIRIALQAYCAECSQSGNKIADASIVNLSIQTQDGEGAFPLLSRLSGFFADNDRTEAASINRLNTATVDENNRVIEWLNKLKNAFSAEGITLNGPVTAAEIVNTQARIRFSYTTSTEATDYKLALYDAQGVGQVVTMAKHNNIAGLMGNGTIEVTFENLADGTEAYFILDNIQPGWLLKIRGIAKDASGNDTKLASNWKSLLLLDKVPPTTVIQESYGHGDGISILKGKGGQSANPLDGALAVPNMNVTPFVYSGNNDVQESLSRLYGSKDIVNVQDAGGNSITQGYLNSYDEYAFSVWSINYQNVTMGVAFTGDVAVTRAAQYQGDTELTDYLANNNVLDVASGEEADLVTFKVSNLLTFANDDGKLLSFQGSVQDASSVGTDANTFADSSAQVIVKDKMPPFVTKTEVINNLNGRRITVTFNEPVSLKAGDELALLSGDTIIAGSDKGPSKVIVFERSEINAGNPLQRVFTTLNSDPSLKVHPFIPLHFESVEDSQGNSWVDYLSDALPNGNCTVALPPNAKECLDEVPVYMVSLPLFERVGLPAATNFEVGKTEFTVTYNFNLPIDLVELMGTLTPNGADLDAFGFKLVRGGVSIPFEVSSSASLSGDQTLVVNIVLSAANALVEFDLFDAPRNFKPKDSYQLFTPAQVLIDPDVQVVGDHGATDAPRL